MNEMDLQSAFWDFYAYISQPHIWQTISKEERAALYQAKHTAKGKVQRRNKPVQIGVERLKSLMDKYAPGRYEISVSVRIRI